MELRVEKPGLTAALSVGEDPGRDGCTLIVLAEDDGENLEIKLPKGHGDEPVFDQQGVRVWCDEQGLPHREGDLPAFVIFGGYSQWFRHGKMHREGRPAVLNDSGDQWWWVNGELHREDGPAVILRSGYAQWWWRGVEIAKDTDDWHQVFCP